MIFAAGLGTRLGELTRSTPKALIPVAGVPMLERVARRLIDAGADRLIINTHAFAEQIIEFVQSRDSFGVDVVFSPEVEEPLETGGGLLKAAPLFQSISPFFVHNADILSDIPLADIYRHHVERQPVATLAVMPRDSSRKLLFDDDGLLGRVDDGKGIRLQSRPSRGEVRALAFAGIHVLSQSIFGMMTERGVFSIVDVYVRLAGAGVRIEPYDVDGRMWIDVGKPRQLAEANRALRR